MAETGSARPWAAYVRAVMGNELTQKQAAQQVNEHFGGDFAQATISRWLDDDNTATPDPARAAAFALAFGRSPLEAFVAGGLLRLEDARRGLGAESVALLKRLSQGGPIRVSRTLEAPERDKPRPRPHEH